jgi:hypothetical protein
VASSDNCPLLDGCYGDIVEGYDPGQLGDVGRKSAEIMIATVNLYCDGQFRVEILDLLLAWLE